MAKKKLSEHPIYKQIMDHINECNYMHIKDVINDYKNRHTTNLGLVELCVIHAIKDHALNKDNYSKQTITRFLYQSLDAIVPKPTFF